MLVLLLTCFVRGSPITLLPFIDDREPNGIFTMLGTNQHEEALLLLKDTLHETGAQVVEDIAIFAVHYGNEKIVKYIFDKFNTENFSKWFADEYIDELVKNDRFSLLSSFLNERLDSVECKNHLWHTFYSFILPTISHIKPKLYQMILNAFKKVYPAELDDMVGDSTTNMDHLQIVLQRCMIFKEPNVFLENTVHDMKSLAELANSILPFTREEEMHHQLMTWEFPKDNRYDTGVRFRFRKLLKRGHEITHTIRKSVKIKTIYSIAMEDFACTVNSTAFPKMIQFLRREKLTCNVPKTDTFRYFRTGYESCNFGNDVAFQIRDEFDIWLKNVIVEQEFYMESLSKSRSKFDRLYKFDKYQVMPKKISYWKNELSKFFEGPVDVKIEVQMSGSRATNTQTDTSDVDLNVVVDWISESNVKDRMKAIYFLNKIVNTIVAYIKFQKGDEMIQENWITYSQTNTGLPIHKIAHIKSNCDVDVAFTENPDRYFENEAVFKMYNSFLQHDPTASPHPFLFGLRMRIGKYIVDNNLEHYIQKMKKRFKGRLKSFSITFACVYLHHQSFKKSFSGSMRIQMQAFWDKGKVGFSFQEFHSNDVNLYGIRELRYLLENDKLLGMSHYEISEYFHWLSIQYKQQNIFRRKSVVEASVKSALFHELSEIVSAWKDEDPIEYLENFVQECKQIVRFEFYGNSIDLKLMDFNTIQELYYDYKPSYRI